MSHNRTPFEMLYGKGPDLSGLRVLGCMAYVRVAKEYHDGKFGPRAREGIMVSYGKGTSYRVAMNITKNVILSQDLTFDKFDTLPKQDLHGNDPCTKIELDELETEFMGEGSDVVHTPEIAGNNEKEPQAEIYQHIFSLDINKGINSMVPYSSIKTVMKIQD